jgi:hypothetical protein
MVIPEVTAKTGELISEVLRKLPTIDVVAADRRTHVESDSCPTNDRANGLLNQFILRALEGNPQVCTYSWAYRQLFNASYRKWSQAYVHQVLAVAQRTPPKELPGLGAVRLDTFVVAKRNGIQVTATGNLLDTRAKIGRGYSERPWFLIDDLETTNALRTDQTRGDSGPKTYGD